MESEKDSVPGLLICPPRACGQCLSLARPEHVLLSDAHPSDLISFILTAA